ncbi:DHA2 family efflux MFS transporter permease subunit [Hyphomicrobium sp.]|jgi:EmrB/QacA subfamily drug resistance transporter|uniref:DHA2 family efflux MFS transporter permease subunit n=1 Tax=Hyphomicrobium sp. TaxID=82 RepID=UPI002C2881D7|nr:DHA2 family efflux MFS transporter permease subunit [Hyphomicrobium sp.]HVZ06070.1 DHA2 family efflux MFS transporter permease subunit [Hyphomicrobium sp.]
MTELLRRNLIPLIVATALFMENMDATVLATSLPAIARDLHVNPINLKLALTTYLLALAVFIPASGWMADRFGAKNVFRAAMVVFAAGSIACALSTSLVTLVAARVLQGMGGAMMTPVGRLIVLRTVPRAEIIGAIAWLSIPALVGPVVGPPLGGFITTYFTWRWIFWINIPVALLGLALITRFIPDVREETPAGFDLRGFLLIGPGLSLFLTGVTLMGIGLATPETVAIVTLIGAVLLVAYIWHAMRVPEPLIDLKLLSIQTYRVGVLGGFLFRIGLGAGPFLLPLLFQAGFGMTAFQSGMLTFATGIGAMVMKTQVATILRRYGFRRVLLANAIVSSLFALLPAVFTIDTPALLIILLFLAGGLSRSLQFTSLNTLAYADVPPELLSRATSFAAVCQNLSGSVGVTVAAIGLELVQKAWGGNAIDAGHFPPVFILIAVISASSMLWFMQLSSSAGASLLPTDAMKAAEPAKDAARLSEEPL